MKRAGQKAPTGTKEWADSNVNFQKGCENDCRYCFAKSMAIRFRTTTPGKWHIPTVVHKGVNKAYHKMGDRVMYPHDWAITLSCG